MTETDDGYLSETIESYTGSSEGAPSDTFGVRKQWIPGVSAGCLATSWTRRDFSG